MNKKLTLIGVLVTSALISGCASSIKKEVAGYEYHIQDSAQKSSRLEMEIKGIEQKIAATNSEISEAKQAKAKKERMLRELSNSKDSSKRWLSNNRDVYVNGQCITPDHGKKPEPYCPSRESSRKHALAYCSLSVGCDVAMLAVGDELDTFSKRFLASEACSRSVAALQNKGYRADQTVLNAIEALSDTGCRNDGEGFWAGLAAFGGCMMSASIKITKINAFKNCVTNNQNSCYSKYTEWYQEPSQRKSSCSSSVNSITEYERKTPIYRREVAQYGNTISEQNIEVSRLNTELTRKRSQLSEQNERNRRYSELLQEKKKTLAYKLIGK
ncbi:hypothetical protein [Chrysiogenes arsenatis]|uniref:hypothetical protein n=1 Tax=Chrysiogenes arsenatis TaxID=309797 RepID=UPI00042426FD|nr:hypothetical protein [Chrysiogenes arsenatis]